jgi:hypothetical protein
MKANASRCQKCGVFFYFYRGHTFYLKKEEEVAAALSGAYIKELCNVCSGVWLNTIFNIKEEGDEQ